MVYSTQEKGGAREPLHLVGRGRRHGRRRSRVVRLLGADLLVQIVVFLVVSVVCLVALRPVFVKYRDRGKQEEPTHVGQTAVVVEDVDNEGLTGRVETDNRMTWAARSADGSFIPQGAVVRIVGQESVKLIVERKVS